MSRRTSQVAAAMTVLAATVLAALPWGLAAELRLVPPLLPFLVLHYWTLRDVAAVPEVVVFASGLLLDVLTGGPAGYWALIYLVGYALSLTVSTTPLVARALARWLVLGGTLAVLSLAEVLLAAAYFNVSADWSQPLIAAVVATLFYPLLTAILRTIAGPRSSTADSGATWSRPA